MSPARAGNGLRSAHAANLAGLSDPAVLAVAAEQGRILASLDFQTMPRHFAEFLHAYGHSPGVLLVKQRAAVASVIESLVLVWSASDERLERPHR
jgi:hypothetical protein